MPFCLFSPRLVGPHGWTQPSKTAKPRTIADSTKLLGFLYALVPFYKYTDTHVIHHTPHLWHLAAFPPGFAESIMFERNLFQSKFAEFFEITYGEACWLAVHNQCMASETDSMTPDEINAK